MNEETKQFFLKLYLQQITNGDYVDWAITCLEEGFDSKSLRLLAGMSKTHSIKADFKDLFRHSLSELNWNYLDKKESLFNHAKEIAKQILADEIESVEAVDKIHEICVHLDYPNELEIWNLLYDGHSNDWYDRSRWIPFMSTYKHERWLQYVKLEAIDLAKADFLEELK
jgi:hypothetical protein